MSIAKLIRRMSDAGASPEVIAIAVEAIEEADARVAEQRAAARDRKRKQRLKEREAVTVTGQSRDSHDEPSLSLPPSPQTPQPPTHTHPDITTHARGIEKSRRGTRLPEDWEPSEKDRAVAKSEGLTDEDIDRAAREFRNYWCARSRDATRISWPRTWENRVIEIGERLRRDRARLASRPALNGHGGSGVADFATIVAKRRGFAAE